MLSPGAAGRRPCGAPYGAAAFVGGVTAGSLGDCLACPNHVLPTGGTARFSSGLSAQSFLKRISLVEYSEPALAKMAPLVAACHGR